MSDPLPPVTVHFLAEDEQGNIRSPGIPDLQIPGGRYKLLCMPWKIHTKGLCCTSEPDIVTCEKCRKKMTPEQREERAQFRPERCPDEVIELLQGKGEK